MLTISVAGRVLDFSHVVGGRPITGVVSLAVGEGDDVFIVKKSAIGTDVQRLFISSHTQQTMDGCVCRHSRFLRGSGRA